MSLEVERYNAKYVLNVLSKRQKLLLPFELLNQEDYLNIWIGDFEPQVFTVFDTLGITGQDIDFLMFYCKRAFKCGLRFWGSTFDLEFEILKDEYVLRGYDRDLLDQLDEVIIHKIKKYRGLPEETLEFSEDWNYGGMENLGKLMNEDWPYFPPEEEGLTFTLTKSEDWSS
jgi:predicted Zn-dependent protease with MMP-like domain